MLAQQEETSVTEILGKVAGKRLEKRLAPGSGFLVRQGKDTWQWTLLGTQENENDQWVFTYESSQSLGATTTVELNEEYHAAVYQVTLANTGSAKTIPLKDISAMWLRIVDIETTPRVMSSSGGICADHYPPKSSYWTRWHLLQYPFPGQPPIEFSTPTDWSSTQDLPIVMVSPDIESDAPGFIFGMDWSSSWKSSIGYDAESESLVVAAGP